LTAWAGARLTSGQRALFRVGLVLLAVFLFVAPLWYIAMHVVVDDQAITRRVGHRRRRIALSDVTVTRIEPGDQADRVVLTLLDGSEYPAVTRRATELAWNIHPW
jgi:hypothetical protein